MANWFLKNYDFIYVNSKVAGKYNKHKQDGSHLRFPIRMILATVDLKVTSILSMNLAILDFRSNNLSYFRSTQVIQMLLPSFHSNGLSVQEKNRKIDFQDGCHGGHLGFLIGMILAIFDLQVTLMLPT